MINGIKIDKLQMAVIKAATMREEKGKRMEWLFCRSDGDLILGNAYFFAVLPRLCAYIDTETAFYNQTETNGYKSFMNVPSDAVETFDTGMTKALKTCKARIFKAGEEDIYINTDFLAFFDTDVLQFKYAKNILYMFCCERLCGIVLRVRVNE